MGFAGLDRKKGLKKLIGWQGVSILASGLDSTGDQEQVKSVFVSRYVYESGVVSNVHWMWLAIGDG